MSLARAHETSLEVKVYEAGCIVLSFTHPASRMSPEANSPPVCTHIVLPSTSRMSLMFRIFYRCLRAFIAVFVWANGLINRLMAPFFPRRH